MKILNFKIVLKLVSFNLPNPILTVFAGVLLVRSVLDAELPLMLDEREDLDEPGNELPVVWVDGMFA